jgi:hypothetical protein
MVDMMHDVMMMHKRKRTNNSNRVFPGPLQPFSQNKLENTLVMYYQAFPYIK